VPLIMDLVGDPRRAAALKLIVSRQSFARPFAAPPELPAERVETLRAAFDATMSDSAFLAEMRNLVLEVRPIAGAEVQKLVRDLYASPPDVVQLARELVADAP
jgi:tripartite-type tricarboxylate transporter receptor subunit TctC